MTKPTNPFLKVSALLSFYFSLFTFAFGASGAGWPAEWKKTTEAAKKEGQVAVYLFSGSPRLSIEAGVFQKRFPEIKVVTVPGAPDPKPRIFTERRAGKYLADVVIGGTSTIWDLYQAGALVPIRDAMILPEVADESKWWRGRHRYLDPERKYGLAFIGAPQTGGVYYNTKLVNPGEFQSFWDFIKPKWHGKIAARDVRSGGTGSATVRIFYYDSRLGPAFLRSLFGEMGVTLFRDNRQGVDWLAAGKFPICFLCSSSAIGVARRQGLPVDNFGMMKEGRGITSSSGSIGVLNRAPHPNAAKVFINWLLSREGQLTHQREHAKAMTGNSNSLRVDIPKDMVPPEERLIEGIQYIEVDTPERISMGPIIKLINQSGGAKN